MKSNIKPQRRDLFPLCLTLLVVGSLAGALLLFHEHHPVVAAVSAACSVGLSVPLIGWIASGTYLKADIIVTLKQSGGETSMTRLSEYASAEYVSLFRSLERVGVIS